MDVVRGKVFGLEVVEFVVAGDDDLTRHGCSEFVVPVGSQDRAFDFAAVNAGFDYDLVVMFEALAQCGVEVFSRRNLADAYGGPSPGGFDEDRQAQRG